MKLKTWHILSLFLILFLLWKRKGGALPVQANNHSNSSAPETDSATPFNSKFAPWFNLSPDEAERRKQKDEQKATTTPGRSSSAKTAAKIAKFEPTGAGYLYNAGAILTEGKQIAPTGTRVPTKADFEELCNYLTEFDGTNAPGIREKLTAAGFYDTNTGRRLQSDGTFNDILYYAIYWASNGVSANKNYCLFLYNTGNGVLMEQAHKYGFAIRCLLTSPSTWFEGMTVQDTEGNIYGTVKIGAQVWLTANLARTQYNDGTPIPHVTNASEWVDALNPLVTHKYCAYNNDPANVGKTSQLY